MEKAKGWDNSSEIPFQTFELIDGYYLIARVEHNSRKYLLRAPHYLHPVASKFSNKYFTREFVFNQVAYLLFIGGIMLINEFPLVVMTIQRAMGSDFFLVLA